MFICQQQDYILKELVSDLQYGMAEQSYNNYKIIHMVSKRVVGTNSSLVSGGQPSFTLSWSRDPELMLNYWYLH